MAGGPIAVDGSSAVVVGGGRSNGRVVAFGRPAATGIAAGAARTASDGTCGSPNDVVGGTNFRRKRLLRSVTRPLPSTLTRYWSLASTSTSVPVLSHLFG